MLYTLGREDQSVAEWTRAVSPMLQDAKDFPAATFGGFVAAWSKAVSYVGESELYARKAERYEIFETDHAVGRTARQRFERLNALGIEGLKRAKDMMPTLQSELTAYDRELARSGRDLAAELAEHRSVVFAQLADIEMKRSDAEQLRTLVDKATDIATQEGLSGLAGWMDGQLAEAMAARQRPGRGAETNFAFWKLVAVIAILVALGIAFAIHCGIFGCSASSRNIHVTAIIMVAGLWWC